MGFFSFRKWLISRQLTNQSKATKHPSAHARKVIAFLILNDFYIGDFVSGTAYTIHPHHHIAIPHATPAATVFAAGRKPNRLTGQILLPVLTPIGH
jgi:hypothetical protein